MRRRSASLRAVSACALVVLGLQPAIAGDRINNAFDGRSIDIVNGGDFDGLVWLADPGNYSGQDWSIDSAGGGYMKLRTSFTGRGKCLDVIADGDLEGYLYMADCAPIPEQGWAFVDVGHVTFGITNRAWGDDYCVMPDLNGQMASFLRLDECDNTVAQTFSNEQF